LEATRGSQRWLQIGVNRYPEVVNQAIRAATKWPSDTRVEWLSPVESEGYVEYRDGAFLKKLGLSLRQRALTDFWPR